MRRTVQSIGGVFALLALVLLLVSILTSSWLEIEVNRSLSPALSGGGLASYTRRRGLYLECWSTGNLTSVIAANEFSSSGKCLYLDLGVIHRRPSVDFTSEYAARQAQQIAMWVVLGVTALFIFIAIILYLYTLCQHVNNYQWKYGSKLSAGLMIAAVVFNGIGMGLFHGAEGLETKSITDAQGVQAPYAMFFPSDLSRDLTIRTTRMYGWSYALCWCALACELLSAVLFMAISCCYVKSHKKKSVYKKSAPKQTTVVVQGARNPAYEVVHEKVVVAPPQVYMVGGDEYYDGRDTYDPYSHGQPQNGYKPSYDFNKGWVVQ